MVRIFKDEKGRLVEIAHELIDDKDEREIERLILTQPKILGEDLLFIGEQSNFPAIQGDAIDILALDKDANTVIIELKKGTAPSSTDTQLLKYAGYVEGLGAEDLALKAQEFLTQPQNGWYKKQLEEELEVDLSEELDLVDLVYKKFRAKKYEVYETKFNKKQRIVLVAENMDDQIGSALVWLHRQGIDVAVYVYGRFKSDGSEYYSFDQVVPHPSIEEQIHKNSRMPSDRPWKRDGRAWHHNPENNYPENIVMIDALEEALKTIPEVDISWTQAYYLKVYGSTKRELRVYTEQKKGRIDLAFMHASVEEVEVLLKRNKVTVAIETIHRYSEGPWIGLLSAKDLNKDLISALCDWLSGHTSSIK
jgi:hypothetical protein